jgi:hypothetical protein
LPAGTTSNLLPLQEEDLETDYLVFEGETDPTVPLSTEEQTIAPGPTSPTGGNPSEEGAPLSATSERSTRRGGAFEHCGYTRVCPTDGS